MAAFPRKKRRRRTSGRRSDFAGQLLVTLTVAAAVVLGVSLFFRVGRIEVRGNQLYAAEEIKAASGVTLGNHLITLGKGSIAGRIISRLPYVESVRIGRVLPDAVIIEVQESQKAFSVPAEDGRAWLISTAGRVLELAAVDGTYPAITGLTLYAPVAGKDAVGTNQEALSAAIQLLESLNGTGVLEHVASVDVTLLYDLQFWYDDQFLVKFGGTDELSYKAEYLEAVLGRLSDYQTGTIDLTFQTENVARFEPW